MEMREAIEQVVSRPKTTIIGGYYVKKDAKDMDRLCNWLEGIYKDAKELMESDK